MSSKSGGKKRKKPARKKDWKWLHEQKQQAAKDAAIRSVRKGSPT